MTDVGDVEVLSAKHQMWIKMNCTPAFDDAMERVTKMWHEPPGGKETAGRQAMWRKARRRSTRVHLRRLLTRTGDEEVLVVRVGLEGKERKGGGEERSRVIT